MEIRPQFRHPFIADPDERLRVAKQLMRLEEQAARWRPTDPPFTSREVVWYREQVARLALPAGKQVPEWMGGMVDMGLDPRAVGTSTHDLMVIWTSWRCWQAGSCWFELSEALAIKLMLTDLTGCTFDDFKLPIPSFYVRIPYGLVQVQDRRTGFHDVPLLTVASGHRDGDVTVPSGTDDWGAGDRIVCMAYGAPNARSINQMDDCSVWFNTWVPPAGSSTPLDDGFRFTNQQAVDAMPNPRWLGTEIPFREFQRRVLRFVANLSIYLGSRHADVRHQHADEIARVLKGRPKRKCRKTEQERVTRLERQLDFEVGTSVTITPELRTQAYEPTGRAGVKLQFRTLVRGHWRNQACGEGRRDRRHIWIEPHVRGLANDTDLMTHNYLVK